ESTPVHPVVHVLVDQLGDLVDLRAQVVRVQVRCAVAVVLRPLGGEVQGDLGEVVGDHCAAGDVHDGGHGDPARVVRHPGEVSLLQPFDTQDRVHAAGVQVERPGPCVMGGTGEPHGDRVLQPEQSAHDAR